MLVSDFKARLRMIMNAMAFLDDLAHEGSNLNKAVSATAQANKFRSLLLRPKRLVNQV